jgi:hypothetical protein
LSNLCFMNSLRFVPLLWWSKGWLLLSSAAELELNAPIDRNPGRAESSSVGVGVEFAVALPFVRSPGRSKVSFVVVAVGGTVSSNGSDAVSDVLALLELTASSVRDALPFGRSPCRGQFQKRVEEIGCCERSFVVVNPRRILRRRILPTVTTSH